MLSLDTYFFNTDDFVKKSCLWKMSLTRRLNDGFYIPVVGLGTYKPHDPGEVEEAVKMAIDVGYRHFDCAWIYGNEAEVGKAIRAKIKERVIKRDDIFITTKLWNNFHRRKKVVEMLQRSLKAMKLGYVDLYLIHWPLGFKETSKTLPLNEGKDAYSDVDYVETWKGMEDCITCGYTRSIGLANFNSEQIERVLKYATYKPVMNQIELHPYLNQKKLIQYCHEREIMVTGYCPLGINELSGAPGFPELTVLDETIHQIARKHSKTPAQVVLNYLVYLGICVVPKSVTKLRIVEHINIFDFKLDPEDLQYLDSCNINQRICPFNAFTDHKYYPF